MKKLIKILVFIILIPVGYLVAVILFGTVTDFKPDKKEVISKIEENFTINDTLTYSILTYNIGYCGLGAGMDFFYDGGKKVRDTEDNTLLNMYNITEWLRSNDTIDFILLQEVDINSRRSYKINEYENFNLSLADYFPFFATNYKVKFVPVPFIKPLGKVESGIMTLSKYIPVQSTRYSYPGNYSWPKSTFMLDRCFMVNRYKLDNKKDLLVINTHNSAYDDGTLRDQQLAFLKKFLLAEYQKGNYLIVGGDWNECPPGFKPKFEGQVFDTINLFYVDKDYMPATWKWSYDNTHPSNRRVTIPYEKGVCPVTLIDFYLTSPNVEVVQCKGITTDFKNSDHQPVILQFKLKE